MTNKEERIKFMKMGIRSFEMEGFSFSPEEKEMFLEAARTGDYSKIEAQTEEIIKKYGNPKK